MKKSKFRAIVDEEYELLYVPLAMRFADVASNRALTQLVAAIDARLEKPAYLDSDTNDGSGPDIQPDPVEPLGHGPLPPRPRPAPSSTSPLVDFLRGVHLD